MLQRKYILPVAIFAGVLHFFFWVNFAGFWWALATSFLYGIVVFLSYRYLERRR